MSSARNGSKAPKAKEDDAWILDMYDAYLEQQAVQ